MLNFIITLVIYLNLCFENQLQANQPNFTNPIKTEINILKSDDLDELNWSEKVLEYVISIKDKYLWNYVITDAAYTEKILKRQRDFLFPKIDKHHDMLKAFKNITQKEGLFLNHGELLNVFSVLYLSNPFDFGLNLKAKKQAHAMKDLFAMMNPSAVEIYSKEGDSLTVELSLINAFMEIFPQDTAQLAVQYEFFKDLAKDIEEIRQKIKSDIDNIELLESNIFSLKETLLKSTKYIAHEKILNLSFDYMMAFIGANIEPVAIGEIFHHYPFTLLFRRILLSISNLDVTFQNAEVKDSLGQNFLFSMPSKLRSTHYNTRTYHMWLAYGLTKLLMHQGHNKLDAVTAVQAMGILYEFLSPTTGRVKQALESNHIGRYYWMVRQTTAARLLAVYLAAGFNIGEVSMDKIIDLMFRKSEKMQKLSYKVSINADDLEDNHYEEGAEDTMPLTYDKLLQLYMNAKFKSGAIPYKLVKTKNNSLTLNQRINPALWYCEVALGGLSQSLIRYFSELNQKSEVKPVAK